MMMMMLIFRLIVSLAFQLLVTGSRLRSCYRDSAGPTCDQLGYGNDELFFSVGSLYKIPFSSRVEIMSMLGMKRHPLGATYQSCTVSIFASQREKLQEGVSAVALTARHCVDDEKWNLRFYVGFGSQNQSSFQGLFHVQRVIFPFPDINIKARIRYFRNDVAFLLLGKLQSTSEIASTDMLMQRLASSSPILNTETTITVNTPLVSVGWGNVHEKLLSSWIEKKYDFGLNGKEYFGAPKGMQDTDPLRCLPLNATSVPHFAQLSNMWLRSTVDAIAQRTKDTGEIASCGGGDSGGPLFVKGNLRTIVGLMSFTKPERAAGAAGSNRYVMTNTFVALAHPNVCNLDMMCTVFNAFIWKGKDEDAVKDSGTTDVTPRGGNAFYLQCMDYLDRRRSGKRKSNAVQRTAQDIAEGCQYRGLPPTGPELPKTAWQEAVEAFQSLPGFPHEEFLDALGGPL